jgi:hypothetical protein
MFRFEIELEPKVMISSHFNIESEQNFEFKIKVENSLQHYTFSNGSLTDVNDNIIDVITNYFGSTLGEIPGTRDSRAQSEFSNIW